MSRDLKVNPNRYQCKGELGLNVDLLISPARVKVRSRGEGDDNVRGLDSPPIHPVSKYPLSLDW